MKDIKFNTFKKKLTIQTVNYLIEIYTMYKMKFIKNTKSLKNIQKLPEKIRKYQKKYTLKQKKIKKITDTDYPPYLKKASSIKPPTGFL